MRVAVYAPLKSPNHPVPSGDRQMARMLIAALRQVGHQVELASEMRSYSPSPETGAHDEAKRLAGHEIERIAARWLRDGPPDLWFCYHPYYKAPDFLGPELTRRFGMPGVTAEASWSERRNAGAWADSQEVVAEAVRRAAVNICFRAKDRDGLRIVAPGARFEMLAPFIEAGPFLELAPGHAPRRIVTVAMMRAGDKLASYRMLARALERIADMPWTLTVAGDGPGRDDVTAAFSRLDPSRIEWLGERPPEEIPRVLAKGGIYAWPGFGEAYGLAYLEAQAAGLPVVAQAVDGVPGVVVDGSTGLLTPPRDVAAFSAALARLLGDPRLQASMSESARRFVATERSFTVAADRLAEILAAIHGAGDG